MLGFLMKAGVCPVDAPVLEWLLVQKANRRTDEGDRRSACIKEKSTEDTYTGSGVMDAACAGQWM